MITRAERRRRKQVIWDRRVKRFYRIWNGTVPCTPEELPVHNYRCKINHRYWRPAENWKEYQALDPSMHLYKNTGTIWSNGYWTKYERHRLNKQSRRNAKLDIKNGIDIAFERTNLK
jgi:hypothetical protein